MIHFEPTELGRPADSSEKDKILSTYGYKKGRYIVPETPEQLLAEKKNEQENSRLSDLMMGKSNLPVAAPVVKPVPVQKSPAPRSPTRLVGLSKEELAKNQKVTTTKEGKKRITPMFLRR
jgi:hypothetical protein